MRNHRALAGGSYVDRATATAIRLVRRSAVLVVGA
jgi:hypothetical protein